MFKIVLVQLLLTSSGYDVGQETEIAVVEELMTPEHSLAMAVCENMARQKDFTEFPPDGYLGVVHLCAIQ